MQLDEQKGRRTLHRRPLRFGDEVELCYFSFALKKGLHNIRLPESVASTSFRGFGPRDPANLFCAAILLSLRTGAICPANVEIHLPAKMFSAPI
jgi:hypothetical protein